MVGESRDWGSQLRFKFFKELLEIGPLPSVLQSGEQRAPRTVYVAFVEA